MGGGETRRVLADGAVYIGGVKDGGVKDGGVANGRGTRQTDAVAICIQIDELCTSNDEFCIQFKMMSLMQTGADWKNALGGEQA